MDQVLKGLTRLGTEPSTLRKYLMAGTRKLEIHATTILCVKGQHEVAIGGDGQVTLGEAVMKADAMKIRKLLDGRVLCGFAGSSADAFALLERFEERLRDFPQNLPRAAIELAKQWRMDRALRQLQAMLITSDGQHVLLISGTGDVIQPTDGIAAIGSGGNYALAAARALVAHSPLSPREIVEHSLKIAGSIDIYTNQNVVVETLPSTPLAP
jgi:ATP-dependent HslUV protease, peptidase subunit HslV